MPEIEAPKTERNCGNCACAFLAKHPQEIGRTQLLCRKNPPMLVQQTGEIDGRRVQAVSLTYALTAADLVCFDGWRPAGTLPGAQVPPLLKLAGTPPEDTQGI